MKLRKHRVVPLIIVALVVGLVPLATPSFAAAATVVANLDAVPDTAVPPGQASTFSISITPDSRTLAGFTLTTPSGYQVTGVGTASSGTASVQAGNVRVTGASVSGQGVLTVTFTAKASCVEGATLWTLGAFDTQNRSYQNRASDLSTEVNDSCSLELVNQPSNTKAGDLITSGDRQEAPPIQVKLVDGTGATVTHHPVSVTFDLSDDADVDGAILSVTPETTGTNGIATFDSELEINLANVAQFTAYRITPRGNTLDMIEGTASNGFDIWEDATKCNGANCTLNHGDDQYVVPNGTSGALLSASTFAPDESEIDCSAFGYISITDEVIWHEYTGTAPVLVKMHLTKAEMKLNSNNGQARVEVCEGLVDEPGATGAPGDGLTGQEKWAAVGVTNAVHQDSDGDGTDDIWVALAPACPNQNPSAFAPCIFRQYGDGSGGSWTEIWLTGGDPPRRT